jgi:hypothetical protein
VDFRHFWSSQCSTKSIPYHIPCSSHQIVYNTLRAFEFHIHFRTTKPRLALQAELGLAVRAHGTPSSLIGSLAVVTNGSRLPWLIEGLKVETIEAPVKQGAESVLVEVLSVLETSLSRLVVGANSSRPTSLTVPDLGHVIAGDLLDVGNGLVHVVEVDVAGMCVSVNLPNDRLGHLRRVLAASTLPESEGIDHDDVCSADDGVSSAIGELVPRVCSTDLDALRDGSLYSRDLALEFLAGEVAAVEGL